jgi:hypothetical protein
VQVCAYLLLGLVQLCCTLPQQFLNRCHLLLLVLHLILQALNAPHMVALLCCYCAAERPLLVPAGLNL